jgi:Glycosyltransferase family 87
MQSFARQTAAVLLFLALASYFLVRGVLPAMHQVDSDFPNYLTAAKIVTEGGDVNRLYDDRWFQEQMRVYHIGNPPAGKFAPFPPATALLLVPLAGLTPQIALRVMSGLSLLCLIGSILLLTKILNWRFFDAAVFVLLSGFAAVNSLRLGQPYIVVSACCILGYYLVLKGKPWLAGACFGVFVPIKYFPIVILGYFAFRRNWKVVMGGVATSSAVILLSIAVLGWSIHEQYLSHVLGNHLLAKLSMQDPFTASFQSFDTLYRRLFLFDAVSNPQPLLALPPQWVSLTVVLTKLALLAAGLASLIKLSRRGVAEAAAPSIGVLGILVLLLAPATASYHFVLLWLPVALLIDFLFRERLALHALFILAAYACIGFFPYRLSMPFEGHGALSVLAYPRLWLLAAMFASGIHFIWRRCPLNGSEPELAAQS